MLSHHEVAADVNVFRPDGFIVFPRSEGDPGFLPPNMQPPKPHETEVNYYHLFDKHDDKNESWRASIGASLAEIFGLPKLSKQRTNWKLYDFPANYHFAEQRKGPRHSPRTDPYLFARHGRRFRSTKEVIPHLEWLLRDPSLDQGNCQCKYCHGSSRKSPTSTPSRVKKASVASSSTPRRQQHMTASAAAAALTRGRKPSGRPSSAAQASAIVIRGVEMRALTPGVSIDSVPQRDAEIMREIKQGQCEGFRVGEVAWCRLEQPIVDPSETTRKITQWPVLIEDPTLMVRVAPSAAADGSPAAAGGAGAGAATSASPYNDTTVGGGPSSSSLSSFSLSGRVSQRRSYQVRFLGTADSTKALETQLSPFLSGFINEGLLESALGTIDQHAWLQTVDETPLLDLTRKGGKEPDYGKSIIAFAYAMQTAAILRSTYVVTDVYSTASTGAGVLADLAGSGGGADGLVTPVRPGLAGPVAAADGSTATPAGVAAAPRPTQMYQGLYFGVERIWIGEVVRLRLSLSDLKKLQRELNAALFRALPPDAKDPPAVFLDGDASYVMRLTSIYKEVFGNSAHARVAGEVYQIVTAAKYNHAKKEEAEREERANAAAAAAAGSLTTDGETTGAVGDDANATSATATAGASDTQAGSSAAAAKPRPDAGPQRLKLPEPSILRAKPGFAAMPPLPQGFVMIPLTEKINAKLPQEISLPIELVAGRIYPSYGVPADGPRVDEQVKHKLKDAKKGTDEDTQNDLRARLSVAGLLGGCVKPMAARSEVIGRSTALKAAFEIARGDIIRLITQPEGVSEDELADKQEDDATTTTTMRGEISIVPTSTMEGEGPRQDSNTLGRKRAAEDDEEAVGAAAAAAGGKKTKLNTATTDTTTTDVEEQAVEKPLPEGWVTRESRSSGATYYVYLPTRTTQWERPT